MHRTCSDLGITLLESKASFARPDSRGRLSPHNHFCVRLSPRKLLSDLLFEDQDSLYLLSQPYDLFSIEKGRHHHLVHYFVIDANRVLLDLPRSFSSRGGQPGLDQHFVEPYKSDRWKFWIVKSEVRGLVRQCSRVRSVDSFQRNSNEFDRTGYLVL